nr:RDD family protein [Ornithinimicrobium sp. F0845]
MLTRRLIARAIDSAIAFALACVVVLPFTVNQATDALLVGGFDSFSEFLTDWDPGTVPGGSVGAALEQLQPVVLSTIYLQALVIWAYEWVSLTVTSSSIGKMITRVRVTRHRNSFEPTVSRELRSRGSWLERLLRMGLRAGLVVGPPTLAAGMLLAAAFSVPGAVDLAELFIALTIVLLVVWLAGGVGLHGLATGTRVVGFEWQELKQGVEHQLEYHTGHADEYLHRLQEAARAPGVQRAARAAEQDPRVRSVMAQGRTVAQQAEQAQERGRRDWDSMIEGLRSRKDAKDATTAAARHLGEVYREGGLRGVLQSFTRRSQGPDGQ